MSITTPVMFTGDLSGLTENQKSDRYLNLCQGFDLDPNTYPFKLLRVAGREALSCNFEFTE